MEKSSYGNLYHKFLVICKNFSKITTLFSFVPPFFFVETYFSLVRPSFILKFFDSDYKKLYTLLYNVDACFCGTIFFINSLFSDYF